MLAEENNQCMDSPPGYEPDTERQEEEKDGCREC